MNSCNICDNFILTKECNFLYFLDNIKAHYLEIKNQIKEKDLEIISLKKLNNELNKKVVDIEEKLTYDHETKRRKINSLNNSSDSDAIKVFRQVDLLGNLNNNSSLDLTLSENLAKHYQSSRILNELSNSIQNPDLRTPIKQEIIAKNILSPIENKTIKDIARNLKTPNNNNSILLPKMLRSSNTIISPKNNLISRDKLKDSAEKCKNKINWEMSFIQPIKMNSTLNENMAKHLDSSSDIIACSQNAEKENKRKDRNLFKTKTKKRLKQAKLEFDKKIEYVAPKGIKNQIDETLCEDFIDASPVLKEVKQVRTLRKLTRNNSDDELFDFGNVKKSKSDSMPTLTQVEFDGATSTPKSSSFPDDAQGRHIKIEPLTVCKKVDETNKNKEETKISDNQLLRRKSDDNTGLEKMHCTGENVSREPSSCFILPTQHDIVCIDDSEDVNFDVNTAELFIEMLQQNDETQPILKKMEKQQMKIVNKKRSPIAPKLPVLKTKSILYIDSDVDSDTDVTHCDVEQRKVLENANKNPSHENKLMISENNTVNERDKSEANNNAVPHSCNECTAYKNYLIRTGCTETEIAERLKNCKFHKPLKLHLTPENFWEPRLLSFPENDPRNEVLVDYRFANKISNKQNEK